MIDYFTITFAIYLGRWMLSAVLLFGPLWVINRYNWTDNLKYKEYIDLMILQIIGAFVFYKIDAYIFR